MTPHERQPQVVPENLGTDEGQRRRPDPLRWIWYAFGGALGPRYRQWVLHDLTCRTRWERNSVRAAATQRLRLARTKRGIASPAQPSSTARHSALIRPHTRLTCSADSKAIHRS